jgi:hypothetical protein
MRDSTAQRSTQASASPKTIEDEIYEEFLARLREDSSVPRDVTDSLTSIKMSEISEKKILALILEATSLAD